MTHRQEDEGIDWPLLARYFAGELGPRERSEVEVWAASHPDHAAELEALRRLWSQAGSLPTSGRVDELWAGVAAEIRPATRDVTPLRTRRPAASRKRWLPFGAAAVAAVLVLAFAATGAWREVARFDASPDVATTTPVRRYETAPGQVTNVLLSDGTRITLAPASVLDVQPFEAGGPRVVTLSGEAVFHVTHDERRPFLVHSAHAVTEDLGTVFAVRAYPQEPNVGVFVMEGRVALRGRDAPAHSGTVLEPGQGGRLHVAGRLTVTSVDDPAEYGPWASGRVVFRNATLAQVVGGLERWYRVDIEFPDPSVAERRITLDIPAGSLTEVLDAVAVPLNLRIERNGDLIRLYP